MISPTALKKLSLWVSPRDVNIVKFLISCALWLDSTQKRIQNTTIIHINQHKISTKHRISYFFACVIYIKLEFDWYLYQINPICQLLVWPWDALWLIMSSSPGGWWVDRKDLRAQEEVEPTSLSSERSLISHTHKHKVSFLLSQLSVTASSSHTPTHPKCFLAWDLLDSNEWRKNVKKKAFKPLPWSLWPHVISLFLLPPPSPTGSDIGICCLFVAEPMCFWI